MLIKIPLSIANGKLKFLFGISVALALSGCAGIINVEEAVEKNITTSENQEKKEVLQKASKNHSYLSVKAKYLPPNSPQLPEELRASSGVPLPDLCKSGLKFDDKNLSSVVSLNIADSGSIDEKTSIPVLGFTLKKSGNYCKVVGTTRSIASSYPIKSDTVQINYFLRSSSGNELPYEQIQAAINLLGPTLSTYTAIYKISTTAVLQELGGKANETIEANLKSSNENSGSIELSPLDRNQAFYIPLVHKSNEAKTNVGYVRVSSSIVTSVFADHVKNGFPDYTSATVKNYKSQDSSATPLEQFIASEQSKILRSKDESKKFLNDTCISISNTLSEDYAFTKPDQIFVLIKILNDHKNFNSPIPDPSIIDDDRLAHLKVLTDFTTLDCLKQYSSILSEPAYGIRLNLENYAREIQKIVEIKVAFNDSVYLFNQLNAALKKTDSTSSAGAIKNILKSSPPIEITSYLKDEKISPDDSSQQVTSDQAAKFLADKLSPGKVGCYIGLSNQDLRASLYAGGSNAYALYKGENKQIGYNGWLRIAIFHKSDGGAVPAVGSVTLITPSVNEPRYLIQNAGEPAVNSPECQQLLSEFPLNSI